MEEILTKIGLKLGHVIIGLLGGAIALVFGHKRPTFRGKVRAVFIVILGAIATGFITPAILTLHPLWVNLEHAIAFVVGIFGMGLIEALLNLVTKFKDSPINTISDIWNIIFRK